MRQSTAGTLFLPARTEALRTAQSCVQPVGTRGGSLLEILSASGGTALGSRGEAALEGGPDTFAPQPHAAYPPPLTSAHAGRPPTRRPPPTQRAPCGAEACFAGEGALRGRALGERATTVGRDAHGTRMIAGLGEFSIQEKGNFNTRYHHISSYIMLLS